MRAGLAMVFLPKSYKLIEVQRGAESSEIEGLVH
jgi:hypothetical protein